MSELIPIEFTDVAMSQIRVAEAWWRINRAKAPNAIREELERAAAIIAFHPESGARARNIPLAGVRRLLLARIRYYVYYRHRSSPDRIEVLAFWHASREDRPIR